MSETIVVDQNGRVYLPKFIRKLLRLQPHSLMEVAIDDDRVVLKKVESIAEYGRGMFKHRGLLDVREALRQAALE
jgi:AbrB family looped-hinge helix DNA binding protein